MPSASRSSSVARGGENLAGELRRRFKRMGARADAKVRGLQLQRHGGAGERLFLQPRRHFLGLRPEDALERAEIGDVAVECRFRRHALGLARRR